LDNLELFKAAILGIVEGLTEFLPISSTGHLIVAASLLGFQGDDANTFEIAIQSGAMFAVIWEYRQRLFDTLEGIASVTASQRFALNVVVAFVPSVIAGLLFYRLIEALLFAPVPVAASFVAGGFVILWVEGRHRRAFGALDLAGARRARIETIDDIRPLDALKLGFIQCIAMIPGTSRSGATIIGGMLLGFSRKAATEFSFYLAIPTLISAAVYSIYQEREHLAAADAVLFAIGLLFSFVAAVLCIRWLIRYVGSHDFVPFAWYRIAFGGVILLTTYAGWIRW
jgi:undecaprenyl-diphosphatase